MGYNEQIILQKNLKEILSESESGPCVPLVSLGPREEPPDLSPKNLRPWVVSPYSSRYYSEFFG